MNIKLMKYVAASAVEIILIGLTLAVFIIAAQPKSLLQYAALFFILLSELVMYAGFLTIEKLSERSSPVMLRAGAYSIMTGYFLLTLVISVAMSFFEVMAVMLILIEIAVLAVSLILFVLVVFFSKRSYISNSRSMQELENPDETQRVKKGKI